MSGKEWAFNHDTETVYETIGVSEEWVDKVVEEIQIGCIKTKNQVELMEYAINRVQPKNEVEALYLGFMVGVIYLKKKMEQNPLSAMLAAL